MRVTRRGFLGGLGAVGLVACTGGSQDSQERSATTTTLDLPDPPALPDDPFTLGVASGDPLPDSVVLWTRLAPDPVAGGMPDTDVPVVWEVAADEKFDDVVASGGEITGPLVAHSVHVDVRGLDPATDYWYRFTVGDHGSPVGRTRTAPAPDASPDRIAFAVASCNAYQSGYFTAYRHMADEDLDVVVFLGDYIYELEASVDARPHGMDIPRGLEGYRSYYGLYKTDTDLQAAHAAFPWIVTWDDHEVEDNYAGLEPGEVSTKLFDDAVETFPERRAAAYRAFWEHMPLRAEPTMGESLRLYRDFRFGDLLELPVLDARQYKSPVVEGEGAGGLPRGAGGGPLLDGAFDESRSMLGEEQEEWLEEILVDSDARWKVLAQPSVMAEMDRMPDDPSIGFSMDAWDGYIANRNRLLGLVADEGIGNVVSVGGDIHTSAVTDLRADYQDPTSSLVGSEFVGTSISAIELLPDGFAQATLTQDHVHLYDPDRRGYMRVEVAPDELGVTYRYVSDTGTPDGTIADGTRWVVADGVPGARPA